MDLSIIIVNYRSREKLASCLASIAASDLAGLTVEVVVVDNASGDDLLALKTEYPTVRFLDSPSNLGMGGGNNLGIKNSSGRFILVSNPDIVFRSETIKDLCRYLAEHQEVGLVAPQLVNPDGSLQLSCLRFPKPYIPILRRTGIGKFFPKQLDSYLMADVDHSQVQTVDWVMGACFLVRRLDLYSDGRLFDERYFMYFEDVDLCRQIKQRGQTVVYYPKAVAVHNHMRQSARYPWYLSLFKDRIARVHLESAFKYFAKWHRLK